MTEAGRPERRRRQTLDVVALGAAVAAGAVVAGLLRQPWGREPSHAWLWAALLAAAAAGAWALGRMRRWLPDAAPVARPAQPVPTRQTRYALASLAVALATTTWLVQHLWPAYQQRWHGTVLPWLVALALTLVAGFRLGALRPHEPAAAPPAGGATDRVPAWLEALGVVALAALAVGVRVHGLASFPPGIYVDETNGALDALYILEGRPDSPFGTGWYGTPNAYAYYMAAIFGLGGANWWTLKAASLIPAVLTVIAVYPLGRLMFGRLGGFAAMGFLAINRWHLSMSRWGWNQTVPPLFQVAATYFLLRGLRDRRARDFVASGLLSGLMMYTYLSSRLALATLGLFAGYLLVVEPGGPRAAWRRHGRGLLLYLAAFVVAVAPIAVTHITEPFTFFNRVSEISVFRDVAAAGSTTPLKQNVVDHLRFFHQTGDHQTKHNLPGEPHADPLVGALFLVGLAYGLAHLRDPRRGLLWLWLLLGMAGGVFSSHHESPQSYRTMSAVPAVALLAGDVLARLAGAVGTLLGAARAVVPRVAAATVVAVGLVASGWWELTTYFGVQVPSPAVRMGYNATENAVAHEVLAALERGEDVYVSPRFFTFSPLRFLVYGEERRRLGHGHLDDPPYRLFAIEEDLPLADDGRDALVLVDHYYWPARDYVLSFYPEGTVDRVVGLDGETMYVRFRVPREAIAARHGLRLRLDGSPKREVQVASVDSSAVPADVTGAAWSGFLKVPRSGRWSVRAGAGTDVRLDDAPWPGTAFLARGLHRLDVRVGAPLAPEPWRLEWQPPEGEFAEVPAAACFLVGPPEMGLRSFYWDNPEWRGAPVFSGITPVLLLAWPDNEPFPSRAMFSARYLGRLRVPQSGTYRFFVEADDGGRLWVGGRLVAEGMEPDTANFYSGTTNLEAGETDLRLDYFQLGGSAELRLYWMPPDQPRSIVPPAFLVPTADGDATRGQTGPVR